MRSISWVVHAQFSLLQNSLSENEQNERPEIRRNRIAHTFFDKGRHGLLGKSKVADSY